MKTGTHTLMRVAIFFRDELSRRTLITLLAVYGVTIVHEAAEVPPGDIGLLVGRTDIALFEASFARTDPGVMKRWCSAQGKILVLADVFSLADFRSVTRLGARGYLMSDIGTAALVMSLELAMNGEFVFPSEFGELLSRSRLDDVANCSQGTDAMPPEAGVLGYSGLYQRDIDILRMVAEGRSNREIAKALDLSLDLVKMRLSAIMRLAQVNNRIQVAVWSIQNGLVPSIVPEKIGLG
jgi:DNA-binding NarL/FixJ family response regulator